MVNLKLKNRSWKNLFQCIRNSEIKSEGNFWASIQTLEDQLQEKERLHPLKYQGEQ